MTESAKIPGGQGAGKQPHAHSIPPKAINGLKNEKPNFVIFMPDQLRYDSLGCTGNKVSDIGEHVISGARVVHQ